MLRKGPTMAIRFRCECGKAYRAKDEDGGKRMICIACRRETYVPMISVDLTYTNPLPAANDPIAQIVVNEATLSSTVEKSQPAKATPVARATPKARTPAAVSQPSAGNVPLSSPAFQQPANAPRQDLDRAVPAAVMHIKVDDEDDPSLPSQAPTAEQQALRTRKAPPSLELAQAKSSADPFEQPTAAGRPLWKDPIVIFGTAIPLIILVAFFFHVPLGRSTTELQVEALAADVGPEAQLTIDQRKANDVEQRPEEVIERLGGHVSRDEDAADRQGISIQFYDRPIKDSDLSILKAFEPITDLSLHTLPITDAGMVHLKGLRDLRNLALYNVNVTDSGIAVLKSFTGLRDLWLSGTKVTGNGLQNLEGLADLRDLYLAFTQVNNAGLAHLGGLTKLRALDLNYTKVTGAGFQYLRELRELEVLHLEVITEISEDDLSWLEGLTKLHYIGLDNYAITDNGLAHLSKLVRLKRLVVDSSKLTDRGMVFLKEFTLLELLGLRGAGQSQSPQITDDGLANLAGLANLRILLLSGIGITNAGMQDLKGLTGLRSLLLIDTRVNDAGIAELRAAIPKLDVRVE